MHTNVVVLLELKVSQNITDTENPEIETVLHTDQGSVYASRDFNEILPAFNIRRSMSRAGIPTDNAAMESINGWMKAEMFTDLHVKGERPVEEEVAEYIEFLMKRDRLNHRDI